MIPEGKMKIIEAAKNVIKKSGVHGATMRLVAEEAGVSTGAIYHYFSSKEDILYAVMDHNLSESQRIAASHNEESANTDQIMEEVREGISERFKKEDENRLQFYLAKEAMSGNEQLREQFKEKYHQWFEAIDFLMGKLYKPENDADRDFYQSMGTIMLAAIDGIILQNMLGVNEVSVEKFLKTYDFLLEDGIPTLKEVYHSKYNNVDNGGHNG